jgi:hypothetical protein
LPLQGNNSEKWQLGYMLHNVRFSPDICIFCAQKKTWPLSHWLLCSVTLETGKAL